MTRKIQDLLAQLLIVLPGRGTGSLLSGKQTGLFFNHLDRDTQNFANFAAGHPLLESDKGAGHGCMVVTPSFKNVLDYPFSVVSPSKVDVDVGCADPFRR